MAYLYAIAMEPENSIRWRHRGTTPTFEAFAHLLWEDALVVFVAELVETRQVFGVVTAYHANFRNGTVSGASLCAVSHETFGAPAEAFALLCHYVFTVFPMRIIYLEMVEYNFETIASGEGRVFDIEGRLRENDYYNGRYWDTLILAIRRERALGYCESLFGGSLLSVPTIT